MDSQNEPQRRPEIHSYLNSLEKTIIRREELQSDLESRLSEVLRNQPSKAQDSEKVEPGVDLVPLAIRISSLVNTMEQLNTGLIDLIDRIEV